MASVEPLDYRRPDPRQPQQQRRRRRRRLWPVLALLAVLVALVAGALVRARTEAVPKLTLHRTAPEVVHLPGKPFHPAWPAEGQAAVAVEGLGSLGTSGRQAPVPIASVAKVMTAYLTLEDKPLKAGEDGFRIRISKADVEDLHNRIALDQSVVNVRAGETLTERQALEALMLPSANNVAALLAVHDAGSIPAFVAKMNEAAAELGMSKTRYTDPSGFEETTVSTAADQIKLARAAMANPTFAQIVALPSTVLPVAGLVMNYNELVGHEGYVGIKTGSDSAAGGCLLFAKKIHVGGRTLTVLGAVFGQHDGELVSAALAGADQLAGSVGGAVHVETAIPAGTKVMVARNADGEKVAAVTARPLKQLGWPGMPVRVKIKAAPRGTSLDAGQRVATVTIHGTSVRRAPAGAAKALGEPSLSWRLQHLF
jgi:D-alanyl-D-alanine carboxypeptidase (penicillin-binding protein 5/6)